VAHAIAVFFGREPGSHPFPRVNTQPIALNAGLAFILAILSTIRDLKALFEEQVGLRLARARVSLKKVLVIWSGPSLLSRASPVPFPAKYPTMNSSWLKIGPEALY
jgi:hypothetical protein